MRAALLLVAFSLFTFHATLAATPAAAQPPAPPTSVEYSRDIAPLVNDRCVMCHHAGGSAPFPLTTYEDVRRRARQIGDVTSRRYMPPWKVGPEFGPFIGQHPLSDAEIDLIQRWVRDGAPEGPPSPTSVRQGLDSRPAASDTRPGSSGPWQLGKPDLVVTLDRPYTLQAQGTDIFRIFVIPIPVDRERFVRGIEFLPGNPKVVHHANIRIDKTPASRALDDADPEPGYSGLILRSAEYPDGHFLGWTPGQVAPLVPDDLAWRLPVNTDLVVELHMQPSGRPEAVSPSIGFYFGRTPPTRTPTMLRLGRQTIDIPAGQKRYVVQDSYRLPVDVDLLAMQPHAHYRARQIQGDATRPDGAITHLIRIDDWDFRWQHVYRLVTPIHLQKGTTLSMRYVYDNSPDNPRNPERPPRRARWGQRSADEMGDLWFQVLTRNEADLAALETEFRRKVATEDVNGYEMEIERHPTDTGLHDTVAVLYLEIGRGADAVRHFQASATLEPDSAAAHYNLGTALTVVRKLDDARREFQTAIGISPAYANAHNNLGNILLAQGHPEDAIGEFSEVVRLQPRESSASANLAAAYAAAGQFDRAVEAAERALRLTTSPADVAALQGRLERYRRGER